MNKNAPELGADTGTMLVTVGDPLGVKATGEKTATANTLRLPLDALKVAVIVGVPALKLEMTPLPKITKSVKRLYWLVMVPVPFAIDRATVLAPAAWRVPSAHAANEFAGMAGNVTLTV